MQSIVCALVAACSGCADRWLIYPSTQPMDAHSAERRIFIHDGRRIEVFVARTADQPQAYLLEFGGNSGRAEQIAWRSANLWSPHPVEVWAMNYPGFGKSDGPASLQFFPAAALATYDQMRKEASGRPIFVNGYSLGTTVALYVAAHRPVAGMILQSPPPLQREIMWHYGWWNLWMVASVTALEIPWELNSLVNAPKVNAPAVFILSGADTLIPLKYQMMVVNAYAGAKRLIVMPDAEHTTPIGSKDQLRLQMEIEWLWE